MLQYLFGYYTKLFLLINDIFILMKETHIFGSVICVIFLGHFYVVSLDWCVVFVVYLLGYSCIAYYFSTILMYPKKLQI